MGEHPHGQRVVIAKDPVYPFAHQEVGIESVRSLPELDAPFEECAARIAATMLETGSQSLGDASLLRQSA
jgi:hypothetical protein